MFVAFKIGGKLKWVETYHDPSPVIYRIKKEYQIEFMFCGGVLGIISILLIAAITHRIPFFYTHLGKNRQDSFGIYGMILAFVIAYKIAHKKGWMIEQPVETKPTEKS